VGVVNNWRNSMSNCSVVQDARWNSIWNLIVMWLCTFPACGCNKIISLFIFFFIVWGPVCYGRRNHPFVHHFYRSSIKWIIAGFVKVGGYESLKVQFMKAIPERHLNDTGDLARCSRPSDSAFHLIRGLDDPLPWPGMFFGITIASTWYWCSDQVGEYWQKMEWPRCTYSLCRWTQLME
jgi:hypothetical protein